jgi:HPr kinase/phosphorylase
VTGAAEYVNLHGSCVALSGQGVLILGPSGSGKSSLALHLMAYGCDLISDDRTDVLLRDGWLEASAPEAIRGRIEARGVGLLYSDVVPSARLALAVDLAHLENERLPQPKYYSALGVSLPLLHRVESTHFPAAILQYLKSGRAA